MTDKDNKKQIPLRLSTSLWEELQRWAADEFRSLNGQIEYLLTDCVNRQKKIKKAGTNEGGYVGEQA